MQTLSWVVSLSWALWPSALPSFIVCCALATFQDVDLAQAALTPDSTSIHPPPTPPALSWRHSCVLSIICVLLSKVYVITAEGWSSLCTSLLLDFFFLLVTLRLQINYIILYYSYLHHQWIPWTNILGPLPLLFALRTNTAFRQSPLPSWGLYSDEGN